MIRPALHVVADRDTSGETIADRVARHHAALLAVNAEQVQGVIRRLADLAEDAGQLAANPTQPPGIRDLARRVAEDAASRALMLKGLSQRSPP